jgi:hypothetical protein
MLSQVQPNRIYKSYPVDIAARQPGTGWAVGSKTQRAVLDGSSCFLMVATRLGADGLHIDCHAGLAHRGCAPGAACEEEVSCSIA